jgi:hypothetical protein
MRWGILGPVQTAILEVIGEQPAGRFTYAELAAAAYPGAAIKRVHLVAVGRAVRGLEKAKRVSHGRVKPAGAQRRLKTVRAYHPPS